MRQPSGRRTAVVGVCDVIVSLLLQQSSVGQQKEFLKSVVMSPSDGDRAAKRPQIQMWSLNFEDEMLLSCN